ncbi:MAG TPA: hypothetical protein VFD13_00535, partial [Candidatus Kapabacteria bacterium]|nr:hypothetical protein [Candidatus Kapabacteria bacterium]
MGKIALGLTIVLCAAPEVFSQNHVYCFAESGTKLFAGTDSGVYLTTNNGAIWKAINYPSGLMGYEAKELASIGTNLVCNFDGPEGWGVFRSTDGGANWTPSGSGLGRSFVIAFASLGTNLFAGTYLNLGAGITSGGVSLSTDGGTNWMSRNLGLTLTDNIIYVNALAVIGTNLFAGTNDGVFLSTDSGKSW